MSEMVIRTIPPNWAAAPNINKGQHMRNQFRMSEGTMPTAALFKDLTDVPIRAYFPGFSELQLIADNLGTMIQIKSPYIRPQAAPHNSLNHDLITLFNRG